MTTGADPGDPAVGFEARPRKLKLHAGTVRAIVDNLTTAAEAGETAALDHRAFGLLFAPLASWFLDAPQLAIARAVRRDAARVKHAADAVDEVADTYMRIDDDTADAYRQVLAG